MDFTKYKISEISKIKSGKRLPSGSRFSSTPTLYPYVRARDIKNGKINTEEFVYITEDTRKAIKKYIIEKGDIAITIVANIGDIGFCCEDCDKANLTENAVRLTEFNNEIVYSKYLSLYLNQPIMKRHMESLAAGAAQAKLGIYKIEKIKVFLPHVIYQRRISSILSAYDNLIENNNKRIRLLEQMAENIYKEWFVRFRFPGHEKEEMENGLPKGWKIDKVKAIVKRLPFNRTYKEEELEKDGKVVVIDQSTNDVLGYHNNEPSHYADYNKPLIIFGDHSCKFQLMTQNFSLGENVIPFTTNNNAVVNEYWLFYATRKLIKTEEYKRHWGRFSTMKVLVPKIDLQNIFAGIVMCLEKEKNKLKAENQLLSHQRDLLLPRLMSGKLEVNA